MSARPDTKQFLSGVERSTGGSLRFLDDVELLVDVVCHESMHQTFEDLIFYSKFVVRASSVLRREGGATEETRKLKEELKGALGIIAANLRLVAARAPSTRGTEFEEKFLSPSLAGMENFLSLCTDLARIKNYLLDGNTLPCNS